MNDPADLRDALARWEKIKPAFTPHITECIVEFAKISKVVVEFARQFSVALRRIQLATRLCRWMPGGLALWLAEQWPERWLPRLNIDGYFTDATNDEEETE